MSEAEAPSISSLLKPMDRSLPIETRAGNYLRYFDSNQNKAAVEEDRIQNSVDVSNTYYDLATDFYEYGWGQSFHFAVLYPGEPTEVSNVRHEHVLALKLEMKPDDFVLDVGSGVGGPARNIALLSNAKIVGVNCNDYQLSRARHLTKKANLDHLCSFIKGDFNNLPFENNSFDKAYALEATCHSDDLSRVYGQVCRVLKPGGMFALYEWVMTDKYDDNDPHHQRIKDNILEGSGVAKLVTSSEAVEAMRKAGFEVLYSSDRAKASAIPWYSRLQPSWSLSGFRATALGRTATSWMLTMLEKLRMTPKGSVTVHHTLCKGADGLTAGGMEGIFTPMFLMIGRKPTLKE